MRDEDLNMQKVYTHLYVDYVTSREMWFFDFFMNAAYYKGYSYDYLWI